MLTAASFRQALATRVLTTARFGIALTAMWLVMSAAAADVGTISGRITDSRTGHAVGGAIVRVAGQSAETVSNVQGEFVLKNIPAGPQTLRVDYIGLTQGEQPLVVLRDTTVRQNMALFGDPTVETIFVRGRVLGQERALNMQRTAETLKNVIAADAIGNFPDANVAEALGRVPGISIERDRGEGRYVTIRGVDSELNAYWYEGLSLAAPRQDERAVLLDIIPSELLD